ncbi:hypothetical protein SDC9_110098 [bioreactor metagenome]|uniref:Uncharacterized protein n=1 Tax=bioreactor metagenome TaxID=1076179 RepID=A0A645BDU0_9ZZZZ
MDTTVDHVAVGLVIDDVIAGSGHIGGVDHEAVSIEVQSALHGGTDARSTQIALAILNGPVLGQLIIGAGHGDAVDSRTVQADLGDVAGDGGGDKHAVHIIGGTVPQGSDDHEIVGLQTLQGGVSGIVVIHGVDRGGQAAGLNSLQGDVVAVDLLDLHDLGLDHNDVGDLVGNGGAGVQLHQSALAQQAGNLGQSGNNRAVLTVEHGSNRTASQSVVLDTHALHLVGGSVAGRGGGIGEISSLSILADLNTLVGPLVGGAAKAIGNSSRGQLQIREVLLSKLHQLILGSAVSRDVAVSAAQVVNRSALVVANGDTDVFAGNADSVSNILNLGSLQGVQSQQAGSLTGHASVAGERGGEVVEQAGLVAQLGHVHGPAGTCEALDVSLVAQSAQQHLAESVAGQSAGGTEGAVGVAADVTSSLAIADDSSKGVGGRDVLVRSGGDRQVGSGLGADHQGNDDLGGGATGQSPGGLKGTVLIAGDNAQLIEDRDCFLVLNLRLVAEILVLGGTGTDGDQRHGHNQSQNQRKELFHGFASFKIWGKT